MTLLSPLLALWVAAAAPGAEPPPAVEPGNASLPPLEGQALGVAYSVISGSGFSYTRSYGNGWGWHVAGIGWGQGGRLFANVGGALTRQIDRRPWGTLYGLLGAGMAVDAFAGGEGGLQGAATPQYNLTPGLGFTWGPIALELGLSIYYNQGGLGFGPGYGAGLHWWL